MKDGVFLTRNLVSEPPNILNPITLSKEVLKLRNEGIEVQVLNLTQIKKLKMGALIGVAQGSNNEPRLVTMRWRANQNPIYALLERVLRLIQEGFLLNSLMEWRI